MIVRGTAEEIAENREGRLAPTQRDRLRRMPVFRLPFWPSLLLAPIFVTIGLIRGGTWLWICLAIGLFMLVTGLSRMRQQRRLPTAGTDLLEGLLERVRGTPSAAFEALLAIDGRSAVLLAGAAGPPLEPGQRYRCYVVQGLASMPIVVSMELID